LSVYGSGILGLIRPVLSSRGIGVEIRGDGGGDDGAGETGAGPGEEVLGYPVLVEPPEPLADPEEPPDQTVGDLLG
jgi:hypothetical protein